MSNHKYFSVILIALLTTLSVHSATKVDYPSRLHSRIALRIFTDLNKKIIKMYAKGGIGILCGALLVRYLKPKEKKKNIL